MVSSESWSKVLLLNATILLVISSAFTLDMCHRYSTAVVAPNSSTALPSGRDELKPFILQGVMGITLSVTAIVASFMKCRFVIRFVFIAVLIMELCAVYTNRTAMRAGFSKCHQQFGPSIQRVCAVFAARVFGDKVALFMVTGTAIVHGDADAEEACVDSVHSLFSTATTVMVSLLSLVMCAACKAHEAIVDEEHLLCEDVDCLNTSSRFFFSGDQMASTSVKVLGLEVDDADELSSCDEDAPLMITPVVPSIPLCKVLSV